MDNVKTVQLIYEAFGRGDVPRILEQLSDDVACDQEAPSRIRARIRALDLSPPVTIARPDSV